MDRGTIRPGGAIGGILKAERRGRGGGCRHIATRDRGGAFCPLPVCPTPVEMSPRSRVWGRTWRKGRRGGSLSRMRFSPGIATTAPAPPGGGGGGQRPGGVGVYCNQRQGGQGRHMDAKSRRCRHIATRDRREAHAPPSAPPPVEISPTVQGMGRTWRKGQRGVGDAGILQPETGEGAFCPLPVCPTPTGVYHPRSSV